MNDNEVLVKAISKLTQVVEEKGTRITELLEVICNSLEVDQKSVGMPRDLNIRTAPFLNEKAQSLEVEFFQGLVDQYLKEAMYVGSQPEINRKSGVRVGRALIDWEVDFFKNHLPNYEVSKHKRYILVENEGGIKAMIRVYSDLGFNRGLKFREEISSVLHEAALIECPPERVYFIISSWMNGLDNAHVKDLLGIEITNKELLDPENKQLLEKYVRLYINSLNDLLPQPEDHFFFCAYGDLHPNVYADDLYEQKNPESLNEYDWFKSSISELIEAIE